MGKFAKSVNGLAVRAGDKIRLFGVRPDDPVVGYVPDMDEMLRNKSDKIFTVNDTGWLSGDRWYINVAGWNWDTRNIYKIGDEATLSPDPEPVIFDITTLDI